MFVCPSLSWEWDQYSMTSTYVCSCPDSRSSVCSGTRMSPSCWPQEASTGETSTGLHGSKVLLLINPPSVIRLFNCKTPQVGPLLGFAMYCPSQPDLGWLAPPSLRPSLPPSLTPSFPPSLLPSLPPSVPPSVRPSLPPSLPRCRMPSRRGRWTGKWRDCCGTTSSQSCCW